METDTPLMPTTQKGHAGLMDKMKCVVELTWDIGDGTTTCRYDVALMDININLCSYSKRMIEHTNSTISLRGDIIYNDTK